MQFSSLKVLALGCFQDLADGAQVYCVNEPVLDGIFCFSLFPSLGNLTAKDLLLAEANLDEYCTGMREMIS